jgi:metal-responsive CopG/Arc/MetJ family transcriptional regulator
VKTAISIPDAIFEEAERVAKRRGMSRSELYARAVDEYVKSERFLGVREQLDAVYGRGSQESRLDSTLAAVQSASIDRDDW